jgi:N-acetylneuraminate synthase
MYGSDQAASLEPEGLRHVVGYIRACEKAFGNGVKKVYKSEIPIKEKLRRV